MKRLALIAAMILVAGCQPQSDAERLREARYKAVTKPHPDVTVFHDKTREATCWVFDDTQSARAFPVCPTG